jgi:hypothetical protein
MVSLWHDGRALYSSADLVKYTVGQECPEFYRDVLFASTPGYYYLPDRPVL